MTVNNIHIYPSTLNNQSRIIKEFNTLLEKGLVSSIVFIGTWEDSSNYNGDLAKRITMVNIRVPSKTGIEILDYFIKYIVFTFRVIQYLNRIKFDVINCHNLSVLPIGAYFKRRRKIFLIYDAHELETEVEGAVGLKKTFAKIIEKRAMLFVDEMIVVSHSIKKWYEENYNFKNITVIRNVPQRQPLASGDTMFLKNKLQIQPNHILFIYQGLLSRVRGVSEILKAFQNCSPEKHILFLGNGSMRHEIMELGSKFPNIHYLPPISPSELHKYTSGADIGIHLIKNTCLNHYYCSPNKIFEYLLFGIPQIISNFPDMSVVLDNGNCGWGIEPNEHNLAVLLETITLEQVRLKRKNVIRYRENFGWQNEETGFIEVYNRKKVNS